MGKAASGNTAGLRSLMLYDCHFEFLDTVLSWSKVKRDYCCSQNKLLCATSIAGRSETAVNAGYDCDDGLEHWHKQWLEEKKLWCCANQGKGCPRGPRFDCDADWKDWRYSWATRKKHFCCKHKQRGCETSGADLADSTEAQHFDCEAAAKNRDVEWSDAKKAWCAGIWLYSV